MVDCDIYTSARDALAFVEPMIGDYAVMLFDDWHAGGLAEQNLGEKRAFDEFLRRNRISRRNNCRRITRIRQSSC
jgi:O-methyltransferase